MRSLLLSISGAALVLGGAQLLLAQPAPKEEVPPPVPVEGTEMVMTEHGVEFPREITWPMDGMKMVLVPGGTFRQGLGAEKGGTAAEGPERLVNLPTFYIDAYEVSNDQYAKFRVGSSAGAPRPTGNTKLLDPPNPVCGITWHDAALYAEWAGKQLPTEAMWEKAARGPSGYLYSTGNEMPAEGTFIINRGAVGVTVPATENTGDVSEYGVYHMNGNVSEWVADWFAREAYNSLESDNPQGPKTGDTRVVRGASYFTQPDRARLTYRTAQPPTHIRDEVGFRTIWIPTPPTPESEKPTPTPSPTPLPTTEEILGAMVDVLKPYLVAGTPRLPRQMMAGKAYTTGGDAEVQFINFTPYSISLTMLGPNEELVFKYNEPLPKMSYRNIPVTRERDLYVIAYAPEAPRQGPINLGFIRAESQAIVVIKSELFTPVTMPDGSVAPMAERTEAEQYYTSYNPMWNEIEVQNPLAEPLVFKVANVTVSLEDPQPVGEYTVDPKAVLRLSLTPGRYRVTVDYIGAMGASGDPKEVLIDDRAARRLLTVREDVGKEKGVMVITEEKPFLVLDVSEARSIGLTKK